MLIENEFAKTVNAIPGKNPVTLYEHQEDAMKNMGNLLKRNDSFSSLLVLPTGGGKTLTAAYWLIKNAIDKDKKILWLAHRHLLLEQAAEAFECNSYEDLLIHRKQYKYRIISGVHDKPIHISPEDDVLIISKDSIIRNPSLLDKWLKNQDIFLIIDEAHHAVAKSYKQIISYVKDTSKNMKLLGLTATPFRTSDEEKGALKNLFTDDIVYSIDLVSLITKDILAKPVCEVYDTKLLMGNQLGLKALKSIEYLDVIPENIAKDIVNNKERNNFIVKKYFEDYEKYGPTLVFALNQNHAITLKALFNEKGKEYGIKSDYIISGVRDMTTGITLSNQDNINKIEKFRKGEIQVLINVNILTEGTDLPKTQTVFLTRPTVSTVLMTQMVGRSLRGLVAGGTSYAYIVSFVDDWNNKIAWVNPETLLEGEAVTKESPERKNYYYRLIAISKLEEFAHLVDDTVDNSKLAGVPAVERIPIGMYIFSFIDTIEDSSMEHNHQILVYNNTKPAYDELISILPDLFEEYNIEEETIPEDKLDHLVEVCKENYFSDNMIPSYNSKDIKYLLKYYAQKETAPLFVTLEEIDRKKLDLTAIANKIISEDMKRSEETKYLNSLWDEEGSIIPIYYTNIYFFRKMINKEIERLLGHIKTSSSSPVTNKEEREMEEFPLKTIIDKYPNYGLELKSNVFNAAKSEDGFYMCKNCGFTSKLRTYFQIDHIKPLSKGGLTIRENLQLLCKKCNVRKGDK